MTKNPEPEILRTKINFEMYGEDRNPDHPLTGMNSEEIIDHFHDLSQLYPNHINFIYVERTEYMGRSGYHSSYFDLVGTKISTLEKVMK